MTTTFTTAIARAVSILGHPLSVLSLALLATTAARDNVTQTWQLGIGLTVFATLVLAYSGWQVRRKRWQHVDASGPRERRSLNRFLLPVLAGAALLAWWSGATPALVTALLLSAALILAALATARWCTLSLHLAFAMFAAWLLAPVAWWLALAMLAFAGCIAWSRLRLSRHAPRDLVAGAVAGALAGAWFVCALQPWQA